MYKFQSVVEPDKARLKPSFQVQRLNALGVVADCSHLKLPNPVDQSAEKLHKKK